MPTEWELNPQYRKTWMREHQNYHRSELCEFHISSVYSGHGSSASFAASLTRLSGIATCRRSRRPSACSPPCFAESKPIKPAAVKASVAVQVRKTAVVTLITLYSDSGHNWRKWAT